MAETTHVTTTEIRGLRRSPASHLAEEFARGTVTGSRGVELTEIPFLTMVGVRVDPGSAAGERIAAITGGLPAACGGVTSGSGGVQAIWVGPREFLVVAPDDANDVVPPALLDALGEDPGQVVDLSSNRTTFSLAGPSAREVLEKSCALDLHPRTFRTGTALSTEVGGIPVVLHKTGVRSYRIMPRASFADFLGRWLLDGMREFASPGAP
ncbi:MAG TPA: sarcosine oxidase subunit gamma family protein [Micrococcaceae bacterium]